MPRKWARVPARIKAVRCWDVAPDGRPPEPGSEPRWTEAWIGYRALAQGAEAKSLGVQGHRPLCPRGAARLRKASPLTGRQRAPQLLGTSPGYGVTWPATEGIG